MTLRNVLASLAEGATKEEILSDFLSLKPEDVRPAIALTAAAAHDDLPVSGIPTVA